MQKAKHTFNLGHQDICDHLMVDNVHKGVHADWYCQKRQESISNLMAVMTYCNLYKRNRSCWLAILAEKEKEEAEEEKAKREEKAEKERAEINKIVSLYADRLRDNPNDAELYKQRALLFFAKGYFDQTLADYTQSLQLNPNDAEVYALRGMMYLQKKEYDKALSDFDNALRLNPRCADAYTGKGAMYGDRGEYDMAIENLENALRFDPSNSMAAPVLEEVRKRKKKEEEKRQQAVSEAKKTKSRTTGTIVAGIILVVIVVLIPIIIRLNVIPNQPATQVPTPTGIYAIVKASALNVRSGPSTDYGIQDSIYENTMVEILERIDNVWVRIRHGEDGIGYVNSSFLSY